MIPPAPRRREADTNPSPAQAGGLDQLVGVRFVSKQNSFTNETPKNGAGLALPRPGAWTN
jgi:hypothetical protein